MVETDCKWIKISKKPIFKAYFLSLITNLGKLLIDKDCKNEEYQEQLQRNIINSKIRNIFDTEFNKKFEGSLSIPL